MSRRPLTLVVGLLMLTSMVPFLPGAGAEMTAPELSFQPTLDGEVEEIEWQSADVFEFDAPDGGKSTIRLGYVASTGQLAWGVVLPDDSADDEDRFDLYVAAREVESGDRTESEDLQLSIFADGSWELREGNGNGTTGFPSGSSDSGSSPTQTGDEWSFALTSQRSVTSWQNEGVVEVGSLQTGDQIKIALRQTDVDGDTEKVKTRPGGLKVASPNDWETLRMTGRVADMGLSVSPTKMEAGVGGEIVVRLPPDADGGTLTVDHKIPGEGGFSGFTGNTKSAEPGRNTFVWAPEETGKYSIRATWTGDGTYGEDAKTQEVQVSRPQPGGVTIMDTGSLRVTFPAEADGSPGEWRYLNTRVWATDGNGNQLPLVRLDSQNSCNKEPWVGFANLAQGEEDTPLVLHFDPPVRRAGVAMASPQGSFTSIWSAIQSDGAIRESGTQSGSCGSAVFTSMGDIEGDVERIEVEFTGDDTREVLDVVFPYPLRSTAPHLSVQADPSPLHPGGAATLDVQVGSSHRLTEATVTALVGSQTLATKTCSAPESTAWLPCPLEISVPEGTGSVKVEVGAEDRFGNTFDLVETLIAERDNAPPQASLLPRPLKVSPGGAAAVTATGSDGSGIENITVSAVTAGGELLGQQPCNPPKLEVTLSCTLAVSPPEDETVFVSAILTDGAGNVARVGPKPLPMRTTDQDGDGLPDPLELALGTSPTDADTDNDGLLDGWEVVGVDRDGNGQAELDLASLGANPLVQDIFMEIDWAEHEGHSHELPYGAIQVVRHVLASRGINLHTDIQAGGGPFDPNRYDHGHAAHRALIDDARAGIFMHVLAGHMGGPAAGGGWTIYLPVGETEDQIAGRVGATMLQELGHHLGLGHGGGGTAEDAGEGKSAQSAYQEDYKPNYLSVMNNAYAWGILVETVDGLVRVPSYAGAAIGNLDEASLDEPKGIEFDLRNLRDSLRAGPTHILDEGTLLGLQVRHSCPEQVRWRLVPGAIDWNCNGASEDVGVRVDLNNGGANSGIGTLVSRTDWDALNLEGPPCPHYAFMLTDEHDTPAGTADHGQAYEALGLAPCPLHPPPQTPLEAQPKSEDSVSVAEAPDTPIEEADNLDNDGDGKIDEGFADDDDDGFVNLIDDCPRLIDKAQLDRDGDGRGDLCASVPEQLEGVRASVDPATGRVTVRWTGIFGVWGYNVYRLQGDSVTQLGSGFPTTQETVYVDTGGSSSARYLVAAVNDLADQGPGSIVQPTTGDPSDEDEGNQTDGNATDGDQPEGVPAPGVLLAVGLTAVTAVAAARRRRAV